MEVWNLASKPWKMASAETSSTLEIIRQGCKRKVYWRSLTVATSCCISAHILSHKYTCSYVHMPTHVLPAESNFAEFKWTSKISALASDISVSGLWWLTDMASITIIPPRHYPLCAHKSFLYAASISQRRGRRYLQEMRENVGKSWD